jgi:hypothetical protein
MFLGFEFGGYLGQGMTLQQTTNLLILCLFASVLVSAFCFRGARKIASLPKRGPRSERMWLADEFNKAGRYSVYLSGFFLLLRFALLFAS